MRIGKVFFIITALFWLGACQQDAIDTTKDAAAIQALLDDFHEAAALGDKARYLGHYTEAGVFMGTDESERWPLNPTFRTYVEGRFKDGKGWVYTSEKKNIAFSPKGDVAWFDEVTVSEKWGRFRGTGVLLKEAGTWKMAHYSLTFLVPNAQWDAVSAQVNGKAAE